MIRSDDPSNTKRGGVCIYYKSSLPLRVVNIGYLHECLSFELQIGEKFCNFVALYRSPSQSQDNFETCADNFEMTLELLAQKYPFLLRPIGDFNAKSSNWYNKDKTSFKGNTIENKDNIKTQCYVKIIKIIISFSIDIQSSSVL